MLKQWQCDVTWAIPFPCHNIHCHTFSNPFPLERDIANEREYHLYQTVDQRGLLIHEMKRRLVHENSGSIVFHHRCGSIVQDDWSTENSGSIVFHHRRGSTVHDDWSTDNSWSYSLSNSIRMDQSSKLGDWTIAQVEFPARLGVRDHCMRSPYPGILTRNFLTCERFMPIYLQRCSDA